MRGLKQDRSAGVIIAGHAFVQNVRRGYYELAAEMPVNEESSNPVVRHEAPFDRVEVKGLYRWPVAAGR